MLNEMEKKVSDKFHVILFCEDDLSLLRKNLQNLSKQYQKNYIMHIIADIAAREQFNKEFMEHSISGGWEVHFVNGLAYENLSLLADVIKTIQDGWICFLKPSDEWMPYHLTAMKDATEQCPGSKFFYSQNVKGSLKCISNPYFDSNQIDYSNVDIKEAISLSQMMIYHTVAQNIFLPALWFDSHSDLMVKLSFMKSFSLQKINRFTCSCKEAERNYNRNYFEQRILTISFAVRNWINDNHALRIKLTSKVYRNSVWLLFVRMKLVSSFMLLNEMMCCIAGLRKGIKGGMVNVD